MQLLFLKNKITKFIQGRLPGSVFVWNLILIIAVSSSVALTGWWYYKVYNIYYGHNEGTKQVKKYEPKLNINAIEQVYKGLNLD